MAESWATHASDISDEIEHYGQLGAIRPEGGGSDVPCYFVVAQYDQEERDGDLVQQSDQKVYVSVRDIDTAPTTRDRLVIGGTARRIVTVEPISPGGTVIVYVLQIR
jgi:hypothetical protein